MSDSVWPHRWQPTRLPHPWDSPGKNTGVGCHFLLQCIKGKSESEVTLSCPPLSNPMDCSLPGSFIHRIFQARVLECIDKIFANMQLIPAHSKLPQETHYPAFNIRDIHSIYNTSVFVMPHSSSLQCIFKKNNRPATPVRVKLSICFWEKTKTPTCLAQSEI